MFWRHFIAHFVEHLIGNGRISIKCAIKCAIKRSENALLGQPLDRASCKFAKPRRPRVNRREVFPVGNPDGAFVHQAQKINRVCIYLVAGNRDPGVLGDLSYLRRKAAMFGNLFVGASSKWSSTFLRNLLKRERAQAVLAWAANRVASVCSVIQA